MAAKRGVILGPKFSILDQNGGTGYSIEPNADPTLLRHAVLYFDKIHWAQNAFMIGGVPSEILTLYDAGIADARLTQLTEAGPRIVEEPWIETVRRGGTYLTPMFADMAAAYFKAQAETFSALSAIEPEVWTMGGHAPMWEAPASVAERRIVTEIKINAVLPTPPNDIHIADVIDFKERHRAQFIEFRSAIDEIHARVESSPSPLRAEARELVRLNAAIAEVCTTAKGNWLPRIKSAIKIDRVLSVKTIGKLFAAYEVSANLPPDTSIVLRLAPFAFAVDHVSINFKELLAPCGLPDSDKSYTYLLSLAKEFDLPK